MSTNLSSYRNNISQSFSELQASYDKQRSELKIMEEHLAQMSKIAENTDISFAQPANLRAEKSNASDPSLSHTFTGEPDLLSLSSIHTDTPTPQYLHDFNIDHTIFAAKTLDTPSVNFSGDIHTVLLWIHTTSPEAIWNSFETFDACFRWTNDPFDHSGYNLSQGVDSPFVDTFYKKDEKETTQPNINSDNEDPTTPPPVFSSTLPTPPSLSQHKPQQIPTTSSFPIQHSYHHHSQSLPWYIPPSAPKEMKLTTVNLSKDPGSWWSTKSEIMARCNGLHEAEWLNSGVTTNNNAYFSQRLGTALIVHIKGDFMTRLNPSYKQHLTQQTGIELFHKICRHMEKSFLYDNSYKKHEMMRPYYNARQGEYQSLQKWFASAQLATERSFRGSLPQVIEQKAIELIVGQCNNDFLSFKQDVFENNKTFTDLDDLYERMSILSSCRRSSKDNNFNKYSSNSTNTSSSLSEQQFQALQKEMSSLKSQLGQAFQASVITPPETSDSSTILTDDSPVPTCFVADAAFKEPEKNTPYHNEHEKFRLTSFNGRIQQALKCKREKRCPFCNKDDHQRIQECPSYKEIFSECKFVFSHSSLSSPSSHPPQHTRVISPPSLPESSHTISSPSTCISVHNNKINNTLCQQKYNNDLKNKFIQTKLDAEYPLSTDPPPDFPQIEDNILYSLRYLFNDTPPKRVRFADIDEDILLSIQDLYVERSYDASPTTDTIHATVDCHDISIDLHFTVPTGSSISPLDILEGKITLNNDPLCLGEALNVNPTVTDCHRIVADSGATFHMLPTAKAFQEKYKTPDAYVVVANGTHLNVPFIGYALVKIGGRTIKIMAMYVPELSGPLFAIKQFVLDTSCGFHVTHEGAKLDFPSFTLSITSEHDYSLPFSYHSGNMGNRYCDYVEPAPLQKYRRFNFALAIQTRAQSKKQTELQGSRKFKIGDKVLYIDRTTGNEYPANILDYYTTCTYIINVDGTKFYVTDSNLKEKPPSSSKTSPVDLSTDPDVISPPSIPSSSHNTSTEDKVQSPTSSNAASDALFKDNNNTDLEPELEVTPEEQEKLLAEKKTDDAHNFRVALKNIGKCFEKHGYITETFADRLARYYKRKDPKPAPSSTTPSDRPFHIPSYYKPNTASRTNARFTAQSLHNLLGNRQFKNMKDILEISQPNITIVDTGEIPLDLGDLVNVKQARRSKTPIPLPHDFFDTCHCDIGHGDGVAIGGASYVLLLVDRASKLGILRPLRGVDFQCLTEAFLSIKAEFGRLPTRILTDFDTKLIGTKISTWLADHDCNIKAAPGGRQNQNGLCENRWRVLVNMSRAYLTSQQMPKAYWYWALNQSNIVQNILPISVGGSLTSSFEIVYGTKPDYNILDPLFSVCSFYHSKDGNRDRTQFEAHNMLGIVLGRSDQCDGHVIYNPHTKQFYHKTGIKIDINRHAPSSFNLQYDGGLFLGLLDSQTGSKFVEPFPLGSTIRYTRDDDVIVKGTVVSVPNTHLPSVIPSTDVSPSYHVSLVTGEKVLIAPADMHKYVDQHEEPSQYQQDTIALPSWLQPNSKIQYLQDGIYLKGYLDFDIATEKWIFIQKQRGTKVVQKYEISNLLMKYTSYIQDGTILPGWRSQFAFGSTNHTFVPPIANHVHANLLKNPFAPSSLKKALDPANEDDGIWRQSYDEEFNNLLAMGTFSLIEHEEYNKLVSSGRTTGAIPTMCVLTVKHNNGVPVRAKSRIVVLGNKDTRNWTPDQVTAPVISQDAVRLLAALAVRDKRMLKQGDCKNAFVQSTLPEEELTIVKPPSGCPHSSKSQYWRLHKSLYGLKRAPRHWFSLVCSYLKEIGLTPTKSDPCLFSGTVIEGEPPLYLGLYVDDFVYYSKSDKVEKEFENKFSELSTVDYMGVVDWYLGMKFRWETNKNGELTVYISQEGYIDLLKEKMGLENANIPKKAIPYTPGYPIDALPKSTLDEKDPLRVKITKLYRQYVGMIGWLAISTRPDIAAAHTLLSTYNHCPTKYHLDAAKHVGRYLISTQSMCISYSSKTNTSLHSFVQYPLNDTDPTGFCDSGWTTQDASFTPGKTLPRPVHTSETHSMQGYTIYLSNGPISWSCIKERRTSQSTCEAEVKSINECTKQVEFTRNLLQELGLPQLSPTQVYNDNKGAVDWSKGYSNKNMKWINTRENFVREAIHEAKTIQISHIPGPTNPSDIHTKEHKSYSQFDAARSATLVMLPLHFR